MKRIFALLVGLFLLTAMMSVAGEKEVEGTNVPQKVLDAFSKAHPGVTVTEYSEMEVDGKKCFAIETMSDEMETDYIYSADGKLLRTDMDMAVESLPKEIVTSVNDSYPGRNIVEADKITEGEIVEYEIIISSDNSSYELMVSSEGKILSSAMLEKDEMMEDEE